MKIFTTRSFLISIIAFNLVGFKSFGQTTAIAAGGNHSLFLCNGNTAMSCGYDNSGQLGDTGTVYKSTPVNVTFFQGVIVDNITGIGGGGLHSLFIRNGSMVWSCGNNTYGQLGIGVASNQQDPFPVTSPTGIIAVDGGGAHSLFLKSDNTVWASGENGNGRLGIGTTVNTSTPVLVSSLTGVTSIAAGTFHSLFLKSDGTVWGSGDNWTGQLGNGTYVDDSIPTQASSLSGIIGVAGGEGHSLFLKNNGTVWACGNNAFGQLGDGFGGGSPSTPLQVTVVSGITSIVAGSNHSLFLKNDGTVWACGDNTYGQLGVATGSVSNLTPIQIGSLSGIIKMAAGDNFSLFLKNDGTVWACGQNNYGQLGDGTTANKTIPVQVLGLCSSATGIKDNKNNLAINIYPNPTSGISKFTLHNSNMGSKTIVRDVIGNCVLEKNFTNDKDQEIDLSGQPKGIYFIEITMGNTRAVSKIVLQ